MFDILEYGVKKAETLGAELAQARFDDLSVRTILMEKKLVRDVKTLRRVGMGITVFHKGSAGYSFTVDLSKKSVGETASRALKIAKAASSVSEAKLELKEVPQLIKREVKLNLKKHPKEYPLDFKKALVMRAVESSEEHGKDITSITAAYHEFYGEKCFADSSGTEVSWSPIVTDILIWVVSKRGDVLADGMDFSGGSFGLEAYENRCNSPETIGENAGKWAAEKLQAKPAPAGKYRALCENMLAGVLAHESFGHMTEADFVVSEASPLTGKLGEQLGPEHVTIIDEGTPQHQGMNGFWIPFDDQGIETKKVVIMDRGRLKSYLHSRETASLMNASPTGNARAVNYSFPPIVRMRNTYFTPGDLSLDEALELLRNGVYAVRTIGGQANDDGTFLFNAARGYYVEKGEIRYPLRDVTLSGSILTFLDNIEGATDELIITSSYFGGCGKFEQYPLPTGTGGPHLLLREMKFGGTK